MFKPAAGEAGAPDKALIEAATERRHRRDRPAPAARWAITRQRLNQRAGRTGGTPDHRPCRQSDRAIDGTDPRLRAAGSYRKRLREPVEQAAQHIISLVDGLPPAVEISRRSYGSDPRLRAFFVSADHLDELRSTSTVRDYLQGDPPLPCPIRFSAC